jgi:hypothetical protein
VTSESDSTEETKREFAKLDFTRIHFPSDRVTILSVRQLHPELFDHGCGFAGSKAQPQYFLRQKPHNPAEVGLGDLLYCERLIVAHAYAVAKGLRIPESLEMDIEGFREQVTKTYRELGLASGEHEAAEMLRDLDRQGRVLATQVGR